MGKMSGSAGAPLVLLLLIAGGAESFSVLFSQGHALRSAKLSRTRAVADLRPQVSERIALRRLFRDTDTIHRRRFAAIHMDDVCASGSLWSSRAPMAGFP